MNYTTETVKVYPIDTAKFNTDLEKVRAVKFPDQPNTKLTIQGDFALIRHPNLSIIDEEFCGEDVTDKIRFNIWESEVDNNGKEVSFNMSPSYSISVTLDKLNGYLLPETTLAEFTKRRRGYNARIQNNEREWLRHFNEAAK